MAFPTNVNSQITDAVTQANVKVLGDSPAVAVSNVYQATGQALANAAHSATAHMAQTWVTAQAATTSGVASLLPTSEAAIGSATRRIERG